MTTFQDLGLRPELLASLDELGFTEPTPIQAAAIPFVLSSSRDLIALAQTGTGKTAAFGLPVLHHVDAARREPQALILCPTRELCLQITRDLRSYASKARGLEITAVYGGESISLQMRALKRGAHVVVGTPGRVHDLVRRGTLRLAGIERLVLDEADEMLDMGFKEDLDAILATTPATRQTLLLSATISPAVRAIAREYMRDAEEIRIGAQNAGADSVSHEYYVVKARDRFEALRRILDNLPGVYGILFCRTRLETQEIADKLKRAHYDTEALHGDVSQAMRTKIMDGFKRKHAGLLVATDVAARGIDVSDLGHVINFGLPDTEESYTHRSGRTGRAKKSGVSIAIVTASEARKIRFLEQRVGKKFEHKPVPTGADIFQKQVTRWFDEVRATDTAALGHDAYFAELAANLELVSKADLLKHFAAYRFSHLLGSDSTADLNDRPAAARERRGGGGSEAEITINIGKRGGLNIKEFFGLVNSCRELKGVDIGRIDLGADSSVFTVDAGLAEAAVAGLMRKNWRGREVHAELTGAAGDDARPARGGMAPKRNFKKGGGFSKGKRPGFAKRRAD
jgi:ATP-dependent RNA helicase DeaD